MRSFFAFVLLPLLAVAQTESYRTLPAGGALAPDAREDGVIAADAVGGVVYLFGGRGTGARNDLWRYSLDGLEWSEVRPAGSAPAARFGHTMLFDAPRGRLLVFGGQSSGFFSDVWAYEIAANAWRQLAADNAGPSRRYGHSAVLDAERNRMIISHGFTNSGRFDDTWSFDLATNRWTDISPPANTRPVRRCLHHAVLDSAGNQMLLYGGCASGFGPCPLGDLWSFDLRTQRWTERTGPSRPPGRQWYGAGFDSARRRLLLFGGSGEQATLGDTWEYRADTNTWSQLAVENPPPARQRVQGEFVEGRGFVLFGGRTDRALTNDLLLLAVDTPTRVVNAFSLEEGPIAPGQWITLFGRGLGPVTAAQAADAAAAPVELAGVRVRIGEWDSPLLYVQERQINARVPEMLPAGAPVRIAVTGVAPFQVATAAASPGLHPVTERTPEGLAFFATGLPVGARFVFEIDGEAVEVRMVETLAGVPGVLRILVGTGETPGAGRARIRLVP